MEKGLKLGFNNGTALEDLAGLLEGAGKVSRYVVIHSEEQIRSAAMQQLVKQAYALYRERMQ